jgi:DNA-binding GntR family transcriptional regulator
MQKLPKGDQRKGDGASEQTATRIYADILGKIVRGVLAPQQRLKEEALAQVYEVSRTPVREVLIALERDGLVERIHNRGARVISFTPDDLEQIYDIRSALESLAVRRAIAHMPLNDLLGFERRLETLNGHPGPRWNQDQADLDLELHRFIVSQSHNPRLVAYLENISLLIHSLRLVGYRDDEHARRAGREHLEIVRALLRRDHQLVEHLLAEHIETSKRAVLELFLEQTKAAKHPTRAA